MKTIYITLTIILLSLAIEVITFKPLNFEEARTFHAKYNSILNKRERFLLKKQLTENYGPELAHHISQVPYNERKLWWAEPFKAIRDTYNNLKNKVTTLYQKAKDASQYVAPVVSATFNDVKREMTKAKRVLDHTVRKIDKELRIVLPAVKAGINSALAKTMKDLKKHTENIVKAVEIAAPQIHAAASNYVKDIQRQAQKAGGIIVKVGIKMYKVTLVALEKAKTFVNEQLLPWLKEHVKPIWESAKKKALKQLQSQAGIDTTKVFNLIFDMSKFTKERELKSFQGKFTKEQIAEGLKNVAIETAKDAAKEFLKNCKKQLPWLSATIGKAAAINSPVCVGAASVTIATAGVASPTIAACAMGVVKTISRKVYAKLTKMALKISMEEAPQIIGRLVEEFCPKSGNGDLLICKALKKVAELDFEKGIDNLKDMLKNKLLTGKRRRARQISTKRMRMSVLTASHD